MADQFSFSDSEDDRAVEDVLSQAMDHSILEQIAAINCSSFSTDNLPSDLENRFRKLKSLPTATAGSRLPPSKSKSFTPRSGHDSNLNERNCNSNGDLKKSPPCTDYSGGNRNASVDDFERNLEMKKSPEKSPTEYSDGNRDASNGTYSKSKPKSKSLKSKSNSRSGSSNSRSDSWNLSSPESRSVSPVRRSIGCLWCSPKKEKRKQGKENRSLSSSSWGNDDGYDYDVEFSTKLQKKIMKKAMKEEEKIAKEAEKIVKWAKQASSRMMDVSGGADDELLSDLEDDPK